MTSLTTGQPASIIDGPPAAGRHAALPQPIPATAHTSLLEDHHADH